MMSTLTARELRPAVLQLCKRGNYHDAVQIVAAFMGKGYLDFDAARICMEACKLQNDVPQMKVLSEASVRFAPSNWRSWQLKYQAEYSDARWADALRSLEKIAALTKDLNAEHYIAKSDVYLRLLEPEKSLSELEKVTDLPDPSVINRYRDLKARVHFQQKQYDLVISELEGWLETSSDDVIAVSGWKLLGKSLDAQGEYDKAFGAFQNGNAMQLRLSKNVFSDNSLRKRIEVFRSLFSRQWVESWTKTTPPAVTPVFMIGFPRSGTTLLEQIVDTHPSVQAMEEPPTISTVLRQASALMQSIAQLEGSLKGKVGWKSQWQTVMSYIAKLTDEQVEALRDTYFKVVAQEVDLKKGSMLIEKMPLDTVDIGLILRLFPQARFVVSLRHPADCVLSGYMQNFKVTDAMANFLDLDNAASFYKHVMKLLWQYEEVFDLKGRMHYIRYEDLVMDLEGEARKVLDFLGLPWDDAVLNYDEHAKQRGTLATPSYQGVTQKIYDSSRERWRHYAQWMEPVLPHFREAAERYGYDLTIK